MTDERPVIWLLTDDKPGHRSQLAGLASRLSFYTDAHCVWIPVADEPTALWRAALGVSRPSSHPRPTLIIAAGSGTHRRLLACRRLAPTVVLMKPAFPTCLVSAVIAPSHDRLAPSPKVLQTMGTLNAMEPLPRLTDTKRALVLLGGPSRHFHWSYEVVAGQIRHLISRYPDWHWTISDSRRTPAALTDHLKSGISSGFNVLSWRQTGPKWLAQELANTRFAWVTPDSATMASETITAGIPTALFDLAPIPGSRVAQGVHDLTKEHLAMDYASGLEAMQCPQNLQPRLWEADRAARWIIHRGLIPSHTPNASGASAHD